MDSPGGPQGPIPAYSHGYKHNYSFSMDSPGGPQGPIPAYSPAYKQTTGPQYTRTAPGILYI